MKTLLRNFIAQEKCPPELLKSGGGQGGLYSVTAAVACMYCICLSKKLFFEGSLAIPNLADLYRQRH